MEIICAGCQKPFQTERTGKRFCSYGCREHAKDLRNSPRKGLAGYQLEKACVVCGNTFLTRSKGPERELYCGKKCAQKVSNAKTYERLRKSPDLQRVCEICGKGFTAIKWRPDQRTCSVACNNEKQNVVRRNMAERNLKPRPCAECGNPFVPKFGKWNTQICCSTPCSRKRSNRRRSERGGHKRMRRTYFHKNRLAVLQDRKNCEMCGSEDKRLVVHHKDGSGETQKPNHEVSNLMVLCHWCHRQIHEINYRIIDGELFVIGKIFDLMNVNEVKVIKDPGGSNVGTE